MTPGKFSIPFYKGAAWSFQFLFKNSGGSPLNLTGKSPFVMAICKDGSSNSVLEIEAVSDYDSTGLVTFSLTQAQSNLLPIGNVTVGVRDGDDLPYMLGDVSVYKFPN